MSDRERRVSARGQSIEQPTGSPPRSQRRAPKEAKSKEAKAAPQPRGQRPPVQRRMSRISKEGLRKLSVFAVSQKWAPMRKLTDAELTKARSMFNQMDTDGSGDIDVEELGVAMRLLGQDPTEQELRELICSVDEGDMDGRLQFREFCKLYSLGLDTDGAAKQSDVTNVIASLGGDSRDEEATIEADTLTSQLMKDFDLDVDLKGIFGVDAAALSRTDMEKIVMTTPR